MKMSVLGPPGRYKDDRRGNHSFQFIQGTQNLPMDGAECPTDGLRPKDGIDNLVIGFTEENDRCLHHPHGNEIVVSIWVGDYNTH